MLVKYLSKKIVVKEAMQKLLKKGAVR